MPICCRNGVFLQQKGLYLADVSYLELRQAEQNRGLVYLPLLANVAVYNIADLKRYINKLHIKITSKH